MQYSQSQLLDLTGMTFDRLRHWRKEIPGLKERAGRGGGLSFEEIALLAVLSRGVDALGFSVTLFAAEYPDLLDDFRNNSAIGATNVVLWVMENGLSIGEADRPPDAEVAAMVRIAPIIQRLIERIQGPESLQLNLDLATAESESAPTLRLPSSTQQ